MNRRLGRLGLLASVVLTGSCVSGPAGDGAGRAGGSADVITRAEIERGQWSNVYDLVSTLRPRWVRSRGPDSLENPGQVQVYVDGTRLGDVQLLRTLPTHAIERLEWIDPVSAAGRWGLDHAHGVIFITYGRASPVKPLPPV
ncbi:MAG: hypothetical protein GWM90_15230 [Gemmatimonadetes bacterium]|nr:hypothetical protein [Gemmatimonadota bacterium]NIR37851.1 hypothetical protein [Actinomycetota bacterium]NIU75759.1 hypothetical protein [Gammaproteobacteria bacterium]NIQ55549.1 hypothetical protein [Gemmatimonadota bacterium]NIX45406.1 hypothetical protein [Gemmatimonadota bacterium]